MSTALLVALGAAMGAPARYLLDTAVKARTGPPWGTLVVNLLGAGAAGLVAGLAPGPGFVTLLAVGFLGAFTTASTLAADLLEQGGRRSAGLLVLHVVPGLLLAALGLLAGRAL
jgi:CrcB protein